MTIELDVWTNSDIKNLTVAGLDDSEQSVVRSLLTVWSDRRETNLKRSIYFDGKQAFKDLGLMLPTQLKNAKFHLGWCGMAVRKPAMRNQFEGLRLPGSTDPFELDQILDENSFALEFSEANLAAGRHGVSLYTVGAGYPGESKAQIQAHSAESVGIIWDRRRRGAAAALTISEMNKDKPTSFVVYLPRVIIYVYKDNGVWKSEKTPNPTGEILAVPHVNDPQLTDPLGRSRITGPVMSLTDMAVRAYVRMEGNAEFYSSPQVAIEGIDPEAFGDVSGDMKLRLAMDRLIALTRDEDGNSPTVKQLQQATMTPHSDMLRTVAMAFSGETNIPPNSLGIIHDNPSSAEAIRASERDMLIEAQFTNSKVLPPVVKGVMRKVLLVRDGKVPTDFHKLAVRFTDPEFPSAAAVADALVKIAPIAADPNTPDVILEQYFDDDQIARIKEHHRRANGVKAISDIRETLNARLTNRAAATSAAPNSAEVAA